MNKHSATNIKNKINTYVKLYNIYLVTCIYNKRKCIITSSNTKEVRFDVLIKNEVNRDKKRPSKFRKVFQNDLLKYGVDGFTVELLESNVLEEDRGKRKNHYIRLYGTHVRYGGYNLKYDVEGGSAGKGYQKSINRPILMKSTVLDGYSQKFDGIGCAQRWLQQENELPDDMDGDIIAKKLKSALKTGKSVFGFTFEHTTEPTKRVIQIAMCDLDWNVIKVFKSGVAAGLYFLDEDKSLFRQCWTEKQISHEIHKIINNNSSELFNGWRWREYNEQEEI